MNCLWPIPCAVQDGFYGETAWNTVSSGEVQLHHWVLCRTINVRVHQVAQEEGGGGPSRAARARDGILNGEIKKIIKSKTIRKKI